MIPNLARRLYAADRNHEAVRAELEQILSQLFPGWQSWQHLKPYGVGIFGAFESATCAARLHALGFETVVMHDHYETERVITCGCRVFDAPAIEPKKGDTK